MHQLSKELEGKLYLVTEIINSPITVTWSIDSIYKHELLSNILGMAICTEVYLEQSYI